MTHYLIKGDAYTAAFVYRCQNGLLFRLKTYQILRKYFVEDF